MTKALVTVEERTDGVCVLTLDDLPTRNAMSEVMATEFAQAVERLLLRDSLRAVVITGAGDIFSGGGHLDMLFEKTALDPVTNERKMKVFYESFLCLRRLPCPTIALIAGHAVGAGFCVALACDIRIAASEAKLGLNFVKLGLHPGMGVTHTLPRLVGPARAVDLLIRGKLLSAEEGLRMGLVQYVVPRAELVRELNDMLADIRSGGGHAINELVLSLRASADRTLDECLDREAKCQAKDYAGAEFMEGITAARERRAAKFD